MKRWIFEGLILVSLIALLSTGIMGCIGGGTEAAGDYIEVGYNFDGGSSDIPSSGTRVAITHGLTATPSAIAVTFAETITSASTTYWVSSITDSSFYVNASESASARTFYWMATTE